MSKKWIQHHTSRKLNAELALGYHHSNLYWLPYNWCWDAAAVLGLNQPQGVSMASRMELLDLVAQLERQSEAFLVYTQVGVWKMEHRYRWLARDRGRFQTQSYTHTHTPHTLWDLKVEQFNTSGIEYLHYNLRKRGIRRGLAHASLSAGESENRGKKAGDRRGG